MEQAREQCHDARGVRLIEELWQGLCYGARMLLKNPGSTSITFIEHPQSDKLAKLKRRSLPNGTFSDFPGISIKFHITYSEKNSERLVIRVAGGFSIQSTGHRTL